MKEMRYMINMKLPYFSYQFLELMKMQKSLFNKTALIHASYEFLSESCQTSPIKLNNKFQSKR